MSTEEKIIAYCQSNRFFEAIPDLEDNISAWIEAYEINILRELKGLNGWLIANPEKRPKNYASFINRSLNHAADRLELPRKSTHQITQTLVKGMASGLPEQSRRVEAQHSSGRPEKIDYDKRKRELAEQAKKLGLK